jgi:hypothetical protein
MRDCRCEAAPQIVFFSRGTIAMSKILSGAFVAAGLVLAMCAPGAQAADLSAAGGVEFDPAQQPAELFVNPSRAYPPSCLNAPLSPNVLWQNDPHPVPKTLTLAGDPNSADPAERAYTEAVTAILFRVACTGGKSATLLEIDRATGTATSTHYPTFPGITVTQGTNQNVVPRVAGDPNTFLSNTAALAPIKTSSVFVLENGYQATLQLDYNKALTLTLDNFIANSATRTTTLTLPQYDPAQFPTSALTLPISGYMSSNWTNPGQSGEGMVVQVYDNKDFSSRTLSVAWFTYGDGGTPFWLYGDVPVPIGARLITVPMLYYSGGTFVGTLAAGVPSSHWGLATFTFPDCGHMIVNYNGDASAIHGPKGQGSMTFTRVADVNGLACL